MRRMIGSSPLARGLLGRRCDRAGAQGIIPARAGFTCAHTPTQPPSADHPRSRGVYSQSWFYGTPAEGSSPLARGLPFREARENARVRIIPARAGFTWASASGHRAAQDHPRSRGVYPFDRLPVSGGGGSSPLARGLPTNGISRDCTRRIIPARAGFTWWIGDDVI